MCVLTNCVVARGGGAATLGAVPVLIGVARSVRTQKQHEKKSAAAVKKKKVINIKSCVFFNVTLRVSAKRVGCIREST